MGKVDTVAVMAAAIYAGRAVHPVADPSLVGYDNIARQAWQLYLAVVKAEPKGK